MHSDDRRRAIRESKELLERLRDKSSEPEPSESEPETYIPSFEDAVAKWRREADERDAERTAAKIARRYAERREIDVSARRPSRAASPAPSSTSGSQRSAVSVQCSH